MVCGLDVCDELDELDENSFSDTYGNDREGGYIDEVTGVTFLRDDVAEARMEEMKWYEKFQAFEVTDDTRAENRTQTHFLSMERNQQRCAWEQT